MKKIFPDILSLTGLGLLGYGLFLFSPRVSYCVVGSLLIAYGVALELIPHIPKGGVAK